MCTLHLHTPTHTVCVYSTYTYIYIYIVISQAGGQRKCRHSQCVHYNINNQNLNHKGCVLCIYTHAYVIPHNPPSISTAKRAHPKLIRRHIVRMQHVGFFRVRVFRLCTCLGPPFVSAIRDASGRVLLCACFCECVCVCKTVVRLYRFIYIEMLECLLSYNQCIERNIYKNVHSDPHRHTHWPG